MTRFNEYRRGVKEALEARLVPIEGGPLDGQLILSAGGMQEALAAVEVPPVDEHGAELRTPATVYLDAACHICGEVTRVIVNLESKTLVDDKRRTIAAKVSTDPVLHNCGQLPLPVGSGYGEAVDGQLDWTIDVDPGDTQDSMRVVDVLARVGITVGPGAVDGWTEPEREAAVRWAVASHVATEAGDEPPDAPEHVVAAAAAADAAQAAEVAGDDEACPFPKCALPVNHEGDHKSAKGRRVGPPRDADNADGHESDDDDDALLPGDFPDGYGEGAE